MKSPITGKEMVLVTEKRTLSFRKEEFEIVYHCYKCLDSGESFTTTEYFTLIGASKFIATSASEFTANGASKNLFLRTKKS